MIPQDHTLAAKSADSKSPWLRSPNLFRQIVHVPRPLWPTALLLSSYVPGLAGTQNMREFYDPLSRYRIVRYYVRRPSDDRRLRRQDNEDQRRKKHVHYRTPTAATTVDKSKTTTDSKTGNTVDEHRSTNMRTPISSNHSMLTVNEDKTTSKNDASIAVQPAWTRARPRPSNRHYEDLSHATNPDQTLLCGSGIFISQTIPPSPGSPIPIVRSWRA